MKSIRSFNLDVEVIEWLVEEAKKNDRTVSYILNEILKKQKGE